MILRKSIDINTFPKLLGEEVSLVRNISNIPLYSNNEGKYRVDLDYLDEYDTDIEELAESYDISPDDIIVTINDYELLLNKFLLEEFSNIDIKPISNLDDEYILMESLFDLYLSNGDEYILENFDNLLEVTKAQYYSPENVSKRPKTSRETATQLQRTDMGLSSSLVSRPNVKYDKERNMVRVDNIPRTSASINKEMEERRYAGGLNNKEEIDAFRTARKLERSKNRRKQIEEGKKRKAAASAISAVQTTKNNTNSQSSTSIPEKPEQKPNTPESQKPEQKPNTPESQKPEQKPNTPESQKPNFPHQQEKTHPRETNNGNKKSIISKYLLKGKGIISKHPYSSGAVGGGAIAYGAYKLAKKLGALNKLQKMYQNKFNYASPQKRSLLQRMIDRIKQMIQSIKNKLYNIRK